MTSEEDFCRSPIYARDIIPEHLNDSFLGKGTEEKLRIANKKNIELIVGFWLKEPRLEE